MPNDTEVVQVEKDGKPLAVVKADGSLMPARLERPKADLSARQTEPPTEPRNGAGATIDRRVAEHVLALEGTMQLLYRGLPKGNARQ